jgi:hypothetical protein
MIRTRVTRLKDGFSFLSINPRLGLMYRALKHPGKGGRKDLIQCAYFGFETEAEAVKFQKYCQSKVIRAIAREADRLPDCAWEVKVWEFPELLHLVSRCLKRSQEPPQAA